MTSRALRLLLLLAAPAGCEPGDDCKPITVLPGAVDAGLPADGPAPPPANVTRFRIPLSPELPGTFGSGLAYDRSDDSYWMVTDRGNRTKDWLLRLVRVKIDGAAARIVEVIPITEHGMPLSGADLDPEDIALAPDGTLWVGDEVKPYLLHLNRRGEILARIEPPRQFTDRTDDRGFEGVAVSEDGRKVFAILQQGNKDEPDKMNTLIAAYDVASRSFTEYRYRLDDYRTYDYPEDVKGNTHACGLAAAGPGALYVLERDNQAGGNARLKRVYRVQIPEAPTNAPLPKTLVVDLYRLGYQKEKAEGLTVPQPGVLVVSNDNDGDITLTTELWRVKL